VINDSSICGPWYFLWSPTNDITQSIFVTADGYYTVTVWNNGNDGCCGSYSDSITITSVNIRDIRLSSNYFFLYPNPAHDKFTLSFNEQREIQNGELKIIDVTGRIAYEEKIINTNESSTINCKLSPGVYFVKLDNGEKKAVKKLIIK
jgi:hypothetical protein